MDTEPKEVVGPLDGKFEYKKNKDGTLNKQAAICTRSPKASKSVSLFLRT